MQLFQFDDVNLDKISAAWELSKKSLATNIGKQKNGEWKENVPYYSITINGKRFPGERPFEARWELITKAFDFTGKRVLDCGCNMGLFDSMLLKHGAASSTAFERDVVIVDAALLFAEGLGVAPTIHNININNENNWEGVMAGEYDVALLLSVLKYFKEKDRVVDFLSKIPNVIFEGEINQEKDDVNYFASKGFVNHKIIGLSERKRTIFLFSR